MINYSKEDLTFIAYNGEETENFDEAVHITIKTDKGLEALETMDKFHDLPLDEAWYQKNKNNTVVIFILWTDEYHGIWAVLVES
jgi:hypothetical protein